MKKTLKTENNNFIIKFIITLLLFLIPNINFSEEAKIIISTDSIFKTPTTQNLYGGFVEFLLDYINGTNGMYGQELKDRGLDENIDNDNKSDKWNLYSIGAGSSLQMLKGGYNQNGLSFHRLKNTANKSKIGIYQKVYINDTCEYDFYIYAKSNTKTYFNISFIDTLNQKIYYNIRINIDSSDWKKYSLLLPKVNSMPNWVGIMVSIDTICTLDIDELSLMQSNNVFGVRKEYYDLFKKLKMGILRYPGGTFADQPNSSYRYYLGDID